MNTGSRRGAITSLALGAGLALAAGAASADGPRGGQRGPAAAPPAQVAQARHGGPRPHARPHLPPPRHRFGASVFVAPVPLWGMYGPSWHYGPPFGPPYWYGPPPVVAVPVQPPVYIERGDQEGDQVYGTGPSARAVWHWCEDPRGYYPTVPECPGGWLPVEPRSTD